MEIRAARQTGSHPGGRGRTDSLASKFVHHRARERVPIARHRSVKICRQISSHSAENEFAATRRGGQDPKMLDYFVITLPHRPDCSKTGHTIVGSIQGFLGQGSPSGRAGQTAKNTTFNDNSHSDTIMGVQYSCNSWLHSYETREGRETTIGETP